MKIAFIGLGRMGWHMAGHLANQGHSLCVFDANEQISKKWIQTFAGELAPTLAAVITKAKVVITALPADVQLRLVWDHCFEKLSPGSIWIDHSKTSAQVARELNAAGQQRKISFIDAPVAGGTVGAENGTLTIMGGGDKAAWAQFEPIVNCYASKATWLGASGSGQLTKMANQTCVAGVGQALAEGLAFAEREGLNVQQVLEVMLKGSSTSWMMENRSQAGRRQLG